MKTTTLSLAPLLERFFTQRLMQQRQASPHTIISYRDTFRLLLKFAQQQLHTPPALLTFKARRCPIDRGIPRSLGEAPRFERAQPKSAADRHPLFLSVCRFRTAGPCRPDPTRAGNPQQALYADSGAFPHPSGSRGIARGARSTHLVRSARSHIPVDGSADRSPFVGNDWPDTQ